MADDRAALIAGNVPAIVIEIVSTQGSTPRETGTFMLVTAERLSGTIGGGGLEYAAIDHARAILAGEAQCGETETVLGADSGQCCGGRVRLSFQRLDADLAHALSARIAAEEAQKPEIVLFGGGHVGRALVAALSLLPFRVTVIETRAEELKLMPPGTATRLLAIPESAVETIAPGGAALILTHDHALDFMIGTAALKRSDLAYVGMIGSKTKRGVFLHHLEREGLDRSLAGRLVLPIGGGLKDKRPEIIAALVAAELCRALLASPDQHKTGASSSL